MRKVSCRGETLWCHAPLSFRAKRSGVEKSPSEKFPVAKKHYGVVPDGKPFANSSIEVKHDGAMSDRKLYANSFLPR